MWVRVHVCECGCVCMYVFVHVCPRVSTCVPIGDRQRPTGLDCTSPHKVGRIVGNQGRTEIRGAENAFADARDKVIASDGDEKRGGRRCPVLAAASSGRGGDNEATKGGRDRMVRSGTPTQRVSDAVVWALHTNESRNRSACCERSTCGSISVRGANTIRPGSTPVHGCECVSE